MNRILLGALSALLLVASGLFWWQGRAETERGAPPPALALDRQGAGANSALPTADVTDLKGPEPPKASRMTREQRRFARYDRDGDGRITRAEMMASRVAGFRKLDTDGNNLLTFEEWAVTTSNRFKAADANGDLSLTPKEFATTRHKQHTRPKCGC